MKRSFIDAAIDCAMRMLEENHLKLPPFAYWSPDEFLARGDALSNLRKVMLGWDVTDFGSGDFERTGAVLFTIRNGHPEDKAAGTPYAEKLLFMLCGQEIPYHYHTVKTEDIIVRGAGVLAIQLYNSAPDGSLDKQSNVVVRMDGIEHTFDAGSVIEFEKGASITLTPGLYHRFYAKKGIGGLVAGEVSSINDDRTDNYFLKTGERFNRIEEDAPARHRLCNE